LPRRAAETVDDLPPEEPLRPDDSMCCGSGCENCVWTVYFADLAAWRIARAEWEARHAAPENDHG
jgi:hypothetical protein